MNHQDQPVSERGPAGTSFADQVIGVHDGQILQTREIGNVTIVNTVTHPRPIQLPELPPADPRSELEQLYTMCSEADTEQGRIIVLHGPPGSGKTQLAAHFLDQHLERFTDGILFADLGGADQADPSDVNDVLDRFLRAVHVGADAIPTDFGVRAATWCPRRARHGVRPHGGIPVRLRGVLPALPAAGTLPRPDSHGSVRCGVGVRR